MASSHSLLMDLGGGGARGGSEISDGWVWRELPCGGAVRRTRVDRSAERTRAVLTLAADGEEDATSGADETERRERNFDLTAGRGDGLAGTVRAERDVVRCSTREARAYVSPGFACGRSPSCDSSAADRSRTGAVRKIQRTSLLLVDGEDFPVLLLNLL